MALEIKTGHRGNTHPHWRCCRLSLPKFSSCRERKEVTPILAVRCLHLGGGCLVDLRGIFRREVAGIGWLSVVSRIVHQFRIRRPLCLPRGGIALPCLRGAVPRRTCICNLADDPLYWRSQPDPGNGVLFDDEVVTAIFGPGCLAPAWKEGAFLAVAPGGQA